MATYGEAGKNEFILNNIRGKYSIIVNPETKISQIYQRVSQFQFQSIGTLNLTTNKLTFDDDAPLTKENKSSLSKNLDTFRRQSVLTATAGGATNAEELLLGNTQSAPADRPSGTTQSPSSPTSTFDFLTNSEKFNTIENEKFANGLLIYPSDIDSGQDRIVIVQKFYKSVLGSGNQINIDFNNVSRDRFTNSKEGIVGTAVLPMPNDISETNVTTWGEDSLSTLAAFLGQSALKGANAVAKGDAIEFAKTLEETIGGLGSEKDAIRQFLTLNAAAALVKKTGVNFDPEAFRARLTGTAINPNMELLFQGPKLRSFGFQFKMTPRNKEDARNIRYLIKFFKKGMAPKRKETEPFFLGAPNVFDIHFRSGNNISSDFNNDLKSIGNIKTCALQQCVVNYTPDGFYAAFDDPDVKSQPISVTIQLSFTELTPLYNDNYNVNEDNAGWDINSLNENYYTNSK